MWAISLEVEHQSYKLGVTGSNPVSPTIYLLFFDFCFYFLQLLIYLYSIFISIFINIVYFLLISLSIFFCNRCNNQIVNFTVDKTFFKKLNSEDFFLLESIYSDRIINPDKNISLFGCLMYENVKKIAEKNPDNLFSTYFKNIFLTYKKERSSNEIRNHFYKKVPVYYCSASTKDYNTDKYEEYMKGCFADWKDCSKKNGEKSLPPVAYVGATLNQFSEEAKPVEGSSFGVVFCNGANFESSKTDTFKYFSYIEDKKEKKDKLQDYLNEIFEVSFTAAINLAQEDGKKKLHLIIPQFGMGSYATCFETMGIGNKKGTLFSFYLNAITNAMKNSSFDGFEEITFCFSNFGGEEYVETAYKEAQLDWGKAWQEKNSQIKLSFNFLPSKESFLKSESLSISKRDADTFYCILHAGDEHAYLNNGGFSDCSMEKYLAGVDNTNFLGLPWLLNLFWPFLVSAMPHKEGFGVESKFSNQNSINVPKESIVPKDENLRKQPEEEFKIEKKQERKVKVLVFKQPILFMSGSFLTLFLLYFAWRNYGQVFYGYSSLILKYFDK